jgi:AcrR family transcriptional regulator
VAVDKLLDAAAEAFTALGVTRTRMEDVAAHAECSRGTVYRYFGNRDALRHAYIAREARRVAGRVQRQLDLLADPTDPAEILVAALATALAEVRGDPTLSAWFAPDAVGTTASLAGASDVATGLTAGLLDRVLDEAADRGDLRDDLDRDQATEWVVRMMLSMLTVELGPHRSTGEEAELLRRFLLPALFRPVTPTPEH